MPGITYEYDFNTLPEGHPLESTKKIQASGRGLIPVKTLLADLKRGYDLDGYSFDRTDDSATFIALSKFQEGSDVAQKELMAQTQGLMEPSALLTMGLTDPNNTQFIASPVNHLTFSKGTGGQLIATGIGSIYTCRTTGDVFRYKLAGQPVQEGSIKENQSMISAIERAILEAKVDPSKNMIITYQNKDGINETVELEPLMTINIVANIKKEQQKEGLQSFAKPDWKITLTNNDPGIKINDGLFDQHYDKIKKLEPMIAQAGQLRDSVQTSVQTWTNRLGDTIGPWLGKLIGGQGKLNKTMGAIQGALTDDFLTHLKDKGMFGALRDLPLGDRQEAVTEAQQKLLYPPPYPPVAAPRENLAGAAVQVETKTVDPTLEQPDPNARRSSKP